MASQKKLSIIAALFLLSALACGLFAPSSETPPPSSLSPLVLTRQPTGEPTGEPTFLPAATHTPPAPTSTAALPPSPTAEPASPFKRVTSLAGLLPDPTSNVQVRPLADGSVWIIASQAVLRWDGQAWETVLSEGGTFLAAVDDGGRLWVLRQDTSQIDAWQDGQWTTYSASSGWVDALTYEPNWWAPTPWSAYSGAAGALWLPMGRDVRLFDGKKWTLYTLEDMGFPPPGSEDLEVIHRLAMRAGGAEVWVGECYYSGPGPMGGQGVRWYDGETWHGADAPVGAKCVSAMQVDPAGDVWLGASGVVWRYQPASQEWTSYNLPEALLSGYNFPHPRQLIVDGAGDVWVIMQLCGGASCDGPAHLFRIHDGQWSLVIDSPDWFTPFKRLALDGTGQAWLFWDGAFYRLGAESMQSSASIAAHGVGVGPDGRLWVVAESEGAPTLWLLEP